MASSVRYIIPYCYRNRPNITTVRDILKMKNSTAAALVILHGTSVPRGGILTNGGRRGRKLYVK